MSSSEVHVDVKLVTSGICHQEKFGIFSLRHDRCAHDVADGFRVRMSINQWTHVVSGHERFILFQAKLKGDLLDATVPGAGVMASPDKRILSDGEEIYTTCELFAGGFSGWAHALRRLCDMGYKIDHRMAVDFDPECREAYMKSHGFQACCMPDAYVWDDDELPEHLFVQGDVKHGSWYHLLGTYAVDMLLMSPPCPPWSLATTAVGLMKEEGRLTLDAIGLCNLVKPKVILFENVAAMKNHDHWNLIRDMFKWSGYSLRFAQAVNLCEIAPQNRDRLIIVATLDGSDLNPHLCTSWPAVVRPTLQSFDCVMQLEEPWISQSKIEGEILQVYLDPNLIPRSMNRRTGDQKRTRLDVEQYRLRFPESTFGCVMANYGFAHLLPLRNLWNQGLFGTLLVTPEALRFLSTPEIVILMGALCPMWLPDDHRAAIRMLGNGIATPHALLGIANGLAFLREMSQVDVQELIVDALKKRFTATNMHCIPKWNGFSFEPDDEACRPTIIMHRTSAVTLVSPTESVEFQSERGVMIVEAIRLLTSDAMPNCLYLLPGGNMETRVSLPLRFETSDADIKLYAEVPSALRIPTSAFSSSENGSICVIALTAKGTFMLRREQGMVVSDVLTTLNHNMSTRCFFLTNLLGDRHDQDMICPSVVIARDFIAAADMLDIFDHVRIKVTCDAVLFHAVHQTLKHLMDLFQRTALDELLASLGWFFVIDAEAFAGSDVRCIRLIRKHGMLSMIHEDLVYCLALQLFLVRIKNWADIGQNPSIYCRVKLWSSWIWEGMVDANLIDHFDRVWNLITGWFNIQKPWRYVVNGRTVSPEWPVGSFAAGDETGELKVFMLLGMRGGGPACVLKQASDARTDDNSGNITHMADFEAENFQAAMTHAMTHLVDSRIAVHDVDISQFLELEATFVEGMFCIAGEYDLMKSFLDGLIRKGIQRTLAFCGWMVAVHYTAVFEPTRAQIIFFRKPLTPSVSIDFLRAFLRNALVYVCLPPPVAKSNDAVLTKIKLSHTVIYNAWMPRTTQMQELLDVWDQASSILDDPKVIRLVSHTGCTVNPDFELRHYTRCGPNDETIATLSFMGALHGGGPIEKNIANRQEIHVQQKNALASFLITQGADIQDCVRFIDGVVKGAGPDAISAILGQKYAGKKWDGIVQLAQSLNITVPDVVTKVEKARKKIQVKFQEQAKLIEQNLPVELVVLKPDFLQNADETPCVQIPRVTVNSCGVVLSKFEDAKDWLEDQPRRNDNHRGWPLPSLSASGMPKNPCASFLER